MNRGPLGGLCCSGLVGLFLAAFGFNADALAASQGAQLAAGCAACHSTDRSAGGIPAILGMNEQAIIAAMRAYKASEAPSHVMHAVALSLSEDDLAAVARYLAATGADGP